MHHPVARAAHPARVVLVGHDDQQVCGFHVGVFLHDVRGHFDSQARLLRNLDPAVFLAQRIAGELVAERMRRGVELEQDVLREQRVVRHRDRGDELQRRRLPHRRSPDVRVHLHAVRVRQRHDVAAAGEAAGDADVGLRDIDRASGEKLLEAEERVLILAAGDRRSERAAHLGVAVEVLLHHRLLVPAQAPAHVLELAPEADRLGHAVGVVGVDHHFLAFRQRSSGSRITARSSSMPKPSLIFSARKPLAAVRLELLREARRLALALDAVEAGRVGLAPWCGTCRRAASPPARCAPCRRCPRARCRCR